jgi:pyruvate/2-oxoglutarate/acetoin dehydrogenase E1 component
MTTGPLKKDPWHRNRLIRDGIYHAIHAKMKENSRVVLLGEGSHMKVHFDCPAIEKDFPDRVLTMPISEDGNTNFAVGLALSGMVPIVDVISSDFLYRTMDSICNTVRTVNAVHEKPFTIVIRAEFLTGGPTSGQRVEAMFLGVPGLRVGIPSNPADGLLMTRYALAKPGASLLFEDRMIEDATTPADQDLTQVASFGHPLHHYTGGIRKPGTDVTVVSYGLMQRRVEVLLKDDPRAELIDLRWLAPLPMDAIVQSALKTGALLVVEPGCKTGGVGAEIVARVAELFFNSPGDSRPTAAPPHWRQSFQRLGGPRATIPAARELHHLMFPSDEEILAAVEWHSRGPR